MNSSRSDYGGAGYIPQDWEVVRPTRVTRPMTSANSAESKRIALQITWLQSQLAQMISVGNGVLISIMQAKGMRSLFSPLEVELMESLPLWLRLLSVLSEWEERYLALLDEMEGMSKNTLTPASSSPPSQKSA